MIRQIKLSQYEVELAQHLSKMREAEAEQNGYQPKMGEQVQDAHLMGATGEIAAAKMLNVYPNWSNLNQDHDLKYIDKNNETQLIDVKCNRQYDMYIHPSCIDKKLTMFMKMHIDASNLVSYVGYIRMQYVKENYKPREVRQGCGLCYVIPEDDLA